MKPASESRFEKAQEYAAYLQTAEGRLRLDLAWANLREFLPACDAGDALKALDLGAGTGAMAVKLAQVGFQVTVVDNSKAMLALTESAAAQAGLSHRISVLPGDVSSTDEHALGALEPSSLEPSSLEPSSFDVIVCHNLLEYVSDLHMTLRRIRNLINPLRGIVSILVRNRAGEVLKAALKSGDLDLAVKNLTAKTVKESLYGEDARLFSPAELRHSLEQESIKVIAERGVRVISDYLPARLSQDDPGYLRVMATEQVLGKRAEFAAVARNTQVFARAAEAKGTPQP